MKDYKFYYTWEGEKTGIRYKVGKFYTENGKYYYEHIREELEKAKEEGYWPLQLGFSEKRDKFENEELFYYIESRLPVKNSENYYSVIEEMGINESDNEINPMLEMIVKEGAITHKDFGNSKFEAVEEWDEDLEKKEVNEEEEKIDDEEQDL